MNKIWKNPQLLSHIAWPKFVLPVVNKSCIRAWKTHIRDQEYLAYPENQPISSKNRTYQVSLPSDGTLNRPFKHACLGLLWTDLPLDTGFLKRVPQLGRHAESMRILSPNESFYQEILALPWQVLTSIHLFVMDSTGLSEAPWPETLIHLALVARESWDLVLNTLPGGLEYLGVWAKGPQRGHLRTQTGWPEALKCLEAQNKVFHMHAGSPLRNLTVAHTVHGFVDPEGRVQIPPNLEIWTDCPLGLNQNLYFQAMDLGGPYKIQIPNLKYLGLLKDMVSQLVNVQLLLPKLEALSILDHSISGNRALLSSLASFGHLTCLTIHDKDLGWNFQGSLPESLLSLSLSTNSVLDPQIFPKGLKCLVLLPTKGHKIPLDLYGALDNLELFVLKGGCPRVKLGVLSKLRILLVLAFSSSQPLFDLSWLGNKEAYLDIPRACKVPHASIQLIQDESKVPFVRIFPGMTKHTGRYSFSSGHVPNEFPEEALQALNLLEKWSC